MLRRAWSWLFGRQRQHAYYPEEEPKTWGEQAEQTLGWSDRATWGEGSKTAEDRQQEPFR